MTAPERLPELSALRWLDRPALHVATGLAGHVVVVLLWRLGCVHCRQALAELARLQAEYLRRPFAVVAVHVPTSQTERCERRLRAALQELDGPLTVAVDESRALCNALRVSALPAFVLADADGEIRFRGHGEPNRLPLVEAIDSLLARAAHGRAATVPFVPCAEHRERSLMPRGIAAHGGELWLAAAGHRRVYVVDTDGRVLRSIGSGAAGADDGEALRATFRSPQALCALAAHMLVADAGSHTLRAIEYATGEVATWCGTGRRSTDRTGGGFARDQGLCSPVGSIEHEGAVVVAQAGAHQLWQFDPATRAASAWFGTGVRAETDGGEAAAFVEPWAAAAFMDSLWVVDAGGGTLRQLELAHHRVQTVRRGLARPTAVVAAAGALWIAASWQPAVLRYEPVAGVLETWFDAAHGLVEPVALAVDGNRLWIADAATSCLFAADLTRGERTLRRVPLTDVPALPESPGAGLADLAERLVLRAFCDVSLRIALPLPAGWQLDTKVPVQVDAIDEAKPVLACSRNTVATIDGATAVVLLPVAEEGHGALRLRVRGAARQGPAAAPATATWNWVVPVEVAEAGPTEAEVRAVAR
ncbi:MAG TPA: redoxin family protein [Planctomycetota bacterium]